VCFSMKNSDRTLDRTWSRVDLHVRSALVDGRGATRLGFVTGRWSGLTSESGQFTWAQRKGARRTCDRRVRWSLGPERPVSNATRSDAVARPVTCDRTRPVIVGALWTPTGCRVKRVRSRQRLSLTRAVTVCPVVTGRVRSPRPVRSVITFFTASSGNG
jgi:hypothetical protein